MCDIDIDSYILDEYISRLSEVLYSRDMYRRHIDELKEKIERRDYKELHDVLSYTGNRASRWLFEFLTGEKLGRTWKSSIEVIRRWCGDSYRRWEEENDARDREKRDAEERERREREEHVTSYLHGYDKVIGRLQAGRLMKALAVERRAPDGRAVTVHDFIDERLSDMEPWCHGDGKDDRWVVFEGDKVLFRGQKSAFDYVAYLKKGEVVCRSPVMCWLKSQGKCPFDKKVSR